jgi:3-hydroxyisobutyrate dehydrogenase-like beta-hydroxyacid dehydrogenase
LQNPTNIKIVSPDRHRIAIIDHV